MLQFKGLDIVIVDGNSWKVGGIGGQSDKVIDNVSDNKTNPQVEPGLRPAGAPALRSAE